MVISTPNLPIPMSVIGDKYLLFDIDAIAWLRQNHNICGVFVGTLPQNPSQNVFMGLPMQIMIEEAQLLVELGLAFILDDAKAHDFAIAKPNPEAQNRYLSEIESKVGEFSEAKTREKEAIKKKALKKVKEKAGKKANSQQTPTLVDPDQTLADEDEGGFLFESSSNNNLTPAEPTSVETTGDDGPFKTLGGNAVSTTQLSVTPTASTSLITKSPEVILPKTLPNLPSASYALYHHLHQSRMFFHTPGLRFGSQFSAYPGDPLRFHSHFLAVGLEWDEEIDLMDIVGGGRLGTGVKKGFLLGAKESQPEFGGMNGDDNGRMRCFSIEWAGM